MSSSQFSRIRGCYPLALVVAGSLLVAGCQQTTSTSDSPGQPPSNAGTTAHVEAVHPVPDAPAGTRYHNYCVLAGEDLQRGEGWSEWRVGGFVADFPGFPLALYSDDAVQDATTAHLKVCAYGTWKQDRGDGRSEATWKTTFYYDPAAGGDFADLDTFCDLENKDGVQAVGGDVPIENGWHFITGDLLPPGPEMNSVTEAVVDRSVAIMGPDGETYHSPSPEGTRWHAKNKLSRTKRPPDRTGRYIVDQYNDRLTEVWVYEYDSSQN